MKRQKNDKRRKELSSIEHMRLERMQRDVRYAIITSIQEEKDLDIENSPEGRMEFVSRDKEIQRETLFPFENPIKNWVYLDPREWDRVQFLTQLRKDMYVYVTERKVRGAGYDRDLWIPTKRNEDWR